MKGFTTLSMRILSTGGTTVRAALPGEVPVVLPLREIAFGAEYNGLTEITMPDWLARDRALIAAPEGMDDLFGGRRR